MQPRIRWLVLAILSSALLLIVIDVTVLYLALPSLTQDLRASATEKLWVVNAYPLTMAGLLPSMGALGDRYGYRQLFIKGLSVFGFASLVAAFSSSSATLVTARVLLAVGAAMMMPATLALIRYVFDDARERAVAIGTWGAIASGGAAFGPVIGGVLLEYFWWGSVFLINVPIVLVALILALRWIPTGKANPNRPFDSFSSVQIMIALVGLTLAIKEASQSSPSLLLVVSTVLVGLISGAAFVRRQRRAEAPMIDFELFSNQNFSSGVITALTAAATLMALEFTVSQRFQLVVGLSPMEAGLAILPIPLAALIAGPLSGLALSRVRADGILLSSLTVTALGFLAYLLGYQSGLLVQVAAFTVLGLGLGTAMAAASSTILLGAPSDRAGMAASIEAVSYELGGGLSIAILGSLMSTIYSASFHTLAFESFRTPAGVAMRNSAQDSIDAALLAASALPPDLASTLIITANTAFDKAFVVVMAISAVMLFFASIGVAVLTRKARETR